MKSYKSVIQSSSLSLFCQTHHESPKPFFSATLLLQAAWTPDVVVHPHTRLWYVHVYTSVAVGLVFDIQLCCWRVLLRRGFSAV